MVSNVELFAVKDNEQENLLQFIRGMARSARVVVPAVPYHITQWGNFLQMSGFTKERENLTLCVLCALCG
jgi:hypothetical protein